MNTVKEIFDKLCEFAPLELQTSYDNAGFLVGHASAPVHKALLSLDVTNEVIEEAISLGAGVRIANMHPTNICFPINHKGQVPNVKEVKLKKVLV